MSLHKRSNSQNWYYQFQYKGKRYFGSTGTPNKTRAQQVERELRNKVHGEHYLGEAEEIPLVEAITRYLDARKAQPYYKGMCSLLNKIQGFKLHHKTKHPSPCYGLPAGIRLHELKTRDIERLVLKRKAEGDKPATIKHEIGLIRATINEMHKLGFKTNREIVFPTLKTTYRLRYLEEREEEALLRELDPDTLENGITSQESLDEEMRRYRQDNYDLVVFLLDTGCRYSEAATIPWSAINLAEGSLNLYRNKVGNEDTLYMTNRLRTVLQRRFQNRHARQRYVFENKAGQPRGYTTQAIKKAIERAGLNDPYVVREKGGKVTMHTLRHTFASKLVRHGISLFEVSVLLGHSDPKMTQRYAHLAPNDASRKAVLLINQLGGL